MTHTEIGCKYNTRKLGTLAWNAWEILLQDQSQYGKDKKSTSNLVKCVPAKLHRAEGELFASSLSHVLHKRECHPADHVMWAGDMDQVYKSIPLVAAAVLAGAAEGTCGSGAVLRPLHYQMAILHASYEIVCPAIIVACENQHQVL